MHMMCSKLFCHFLPAAVTTVMFSLTASSTTVFNTVDFAPIKGIASTDLRPVSFTLFVTCCTAFTTFETDVDN